MGPALLSYIKNTGYEFNGYACSAERWVYRFFLCLKALVAELR